MAELEYKAKSEELELTPRSVLKDFDQCVIFKCHFFHLLSPSFTHVSDYSFLGLDMLRLMAFQPDLVYISLTSTWQVPTKDPRTTKSAR